MCLALNWALGLNVQPFWWIQKDMDSYEVRQAPDAVQILNLLSKVEVVLGLGV